MKFQSQFWCGLKFEMCASKLLYASFPICKTRIIPTTSHMLRFNVCEVLGGPDVKVPLSRLIITGKVILLPPCIVLYVF